MKTYLKKSLLLLIVSFVVAKKAQKSAKIPDMTYTVSMERPETNTFQVELNWPEFVGDQPL